MKKNRLGILVSVILLIILLLILLFRLFPQKTDKPKLVVGIVVDQMAYDFIDRYWSKYSDNGFKRLIKKGFFCKNANFIHFPTYTAPGHTCIYTGTVPKLNGIVGNDWYDRSLGRARYCADDSTVNTVGSFSNEGKMSPSSMLVNSITDQLKMSNNNKSKVIGIALKDRGGIFPAGKKGNASYWYDASAKYWITSTYYMKNLPAWVDEFNKKGLPDQYLSKPWNTLLPIEQYTESIADDNKFEDTYNGEEKPVFPHNFPELKHRNIQLLRYSPFGNSITKDFAISAIKGEQLGKGEETDFLCVSFSSTDYVGHMYGPNSVEVEDTYLRIDRDISELLDFINDNTGFDNTLIFLTSDHGVCSNPEYLKSQNIDAGTFFPRIITDSVNMYIEKKYGKSNLASYFINQQLYLNHKLVKESGIDIKDLSKDVAAFIHRSIPGVMNTFNSYDIMSGIDADEFTNLFRNGYLESRSGDVFVNFRKYWIETRIRGAEHGSPYEYDTHVPLIWFGWNIPKGETSERINMTDIAPTIAALLKIAPPEECIGKPIRALTAY
ncbi:alkaline phosphatase family protein [bacterium]|nr:MAG: alkaline phosphatase family protein [bacterium]